MARILVTVALAVYNNVANLWAPFNGLPYVPANILAAALLAVVATGPLDLTASELGLEGLAAVDAASGLLAGVLLTVPLFVLSRSRRAAALIADGRVRELRGPRLAYQVLVRVPLGTVLLEELAFRGVLFAAWRDQGDVFAATLSCAVFGLWHVAPAAAMVRANAPAAGRRVVVRAVAATVVVTACAGGALLWLRLETGSLAAPFAAHAAVNSLATLAGALAGARLERAQ